MYGHTTLRLTGAEGHLPALDDLTAVSARGLLPDVSGHPEQGQKTATVENLQCSAQFAH